MHLLPCRLIRWTHHACIFSAYTLSITLFNRDRESTIVYERKVCAPYLRLIISAITQVHIHFLRVNDLAAVEKVVWIRGALQASHRFHQLKSICLCEILGASQAITVLTAHRAAQPQGQRESRFTD